MEGSPDPDRSYEGIAEALDRLRDSSLLSFMDHRSLRAVLDAAAAELRDFEDLMAKSVEGMKVQDAGRKAVGEGRTALVRASAAIGSRLSEFQSYMRDRKLREHRTLKNAFDWMLGRLLEDIERFAGPLQLDGWSISVSAGLPAGISFSITFSFK